MGPGRYRWPPPPPAGFVRNCLAYGAPFTDYGGPLLETAHTYASLASNLTAPVVTPAYEYLSLGCSKAAERKMLVFAHGAKGKPFSNAAMLRSMIAPRTTDHRSYFCAGAFIT